MIGGRAAGLDALAKVNPQAYARTRNHLDGDVTRLSPYFRHGMLSLREAADDAILRAKNDAHKFVFELAWRDFWQRVWAEKGDAIRSAIEPAKVALGAAPMPDDIRSGRTGLKCMDQFTRELVDDGYVHNHARMWFASYVIHHRKIDWRVAADWYYGQLLDGDWASNHLSWQWVGSTFSAKPYFFNKENLVRFSDGKLCQGCKAQCPFDATYEMLEERLFGRSQSAPQVASPAALSPALMAQSPSADARATLLIHDEMLGDHLSIYAIPAAQKCFVFDPEWMAAEGWSLKRVQFVCDGLAALGDVQIYVGEIAHVVAALGSSSLLTQSTPNRNTHAMLARAGIPVRFHDAPAFAQYDGKLTRFMHFWSRIERQFFPGGSARK